MVVTSPLVSSRSGENVGRGSALGDPQRVKTHNGVTTHAVDVAVARGSPVRGTHTSENRNHRHCVIVVRLVKVS